MSDGQGDLFTSTAATRRAAGHAATRWAPLARRRVFEAIRCAGETGLTAQELEPLTGYRGDTIRPRLVELRAEGRIMPAPQTRPTPSGRQAAVWVVAP